MKKMTFALACASTAALFADLPNTIGFEDYTWTDPATSFKGLSLKGDDGNEGAETASKWLYQGTQGAEDGSEVKGYETVPSVSGVDFGNKFLELSTEGGTLWRSINGLTMTGGETSVPALGAAEAIPANGNIFIDTMVQFTPTEDGNDDPGLGDGDKLAIWLDKATVNGQEVLSLKVRALSYTSEDMTTSEPATFTLARVDGEPLVVDAESWHRLTVMAVPNVFSDAEIYCLPAFTIKLDGNELCATTSPFTSAKGTLIDPEGELLTPAMKALVSSDRVLPSLQGMLGEEQVAQLQAVGFKGSGKIDNLQITDEDPTPPAPASIDFTITAAEGVTVKWSTDGQTWNDYAAAGATAPAGTIYVQLTNADGGVKVVEQTVSGADGASNAFDLTEETFGWPEYLGEAVDGAYVIDNQAEFGKFVAKVATLGSATAEGDPITFKLAANVTFAGVIGAANNKDNLGTAETFAAGAFKGTFDGQNYTISDVELPRADYTGLFGSLYGATVKNLTVAVKEGTTGFEAEGGTDDFCGGLVAGVSVKSTIESVTTATGTFKAQKAAAGIVGYAAGGTVLKDCVNNLNVISMGNEKVAGLVGCAQNSGNWDPAYVTIDGCTNNGNVECQASGKSRAALLVSYSDCEVKFQGNVTANGTVTQAGSTANIQSIININSGSATVVDGAVIKAPAGMKSTIHNSKAHAGLNYATVADGIATFVADSAAVNGANLKVMTTGNTITLANVDDAITLDTTLATATVTTTATDAYVAQAGNVYTVTAKADAEFSVSIDPTEAEWTATLTLPTPSITGTDATGTWSPAAIVEPSAGTTNVYTYTVTVAATETTKETTKLVEFKVYKSGTPTDTYPEYIPDNAEIKGKFNTWVTEKANGDRDAASANLDAFLLNVAPSAVDTAKAAFKIVSIEQDENGAWIAKVTNDEKGDGDAFGNGYVVIKGAATVDGEYNLAADAETAKFFKAFLVLEDPKAE